MPIFGVIILAKEMINMSEEIFEICPDIYRIIFDIPINVDPLNLYFIAGKRPTLIDTGPLLPDATEMIRAKLAKIGFDIQDLDQIIITHGHFDHCGLANELKKITKAKILIHPLEELAIINFNQLNSGLHEEIVTKLKLWGFPDEELTKIHKSYSYMTKFSCGPLETIESLQNGQMITAGNYTFEVIHCPGHSAGLICLYQKEKKILFSSDHILKRITPTIDLYIPAKDGEISGLPDYFSSLDKLAKLDVDYCLPGHGELISDHRQRIKEIKQSSEERSDYFRQLLKENSYTPYNLTIKFIEDIKRKPTGDTLFLALREVMAYLSKLESEGIVHSEEKDGLTHYSLL